MPSLHLPAFQSPPPFTFHTGVCMCRMVMYCTVCRAHVCHHYTYLRSSLPHLSPSIQVCVCVAWLCIVLCVEYTHRHYTYLQSCLLHILPSIQVCACVVMCCAVCRAHVSSLHVPVLQSSAPFAVHTGVYMCCTTLASFEILV